MRRRELHNAQSILKPARTFQERCACGGAEFEHIRFYAPDGARNRGIFNGRRPALAEPWAAKRAPTGLRREDAPDGSRTAFATDHGAIVHAQ